MKALICEKPGLFAYKEAPTPSFQPGHAIIKIKRIGICGTDLHAYQGNQPYFSYPRILGHELSGDLIEADDATGFMPGEKITIIPYLNCGKCIACRNGKPNCCANIQVCGVHVDGGMVPYFSVPSYTLIKSEGLGYDELALVEPLAIGAHGARRASIQKDEFVLVMGAGPIGIGTMEFARIAGAQVIALDINQDRLNFCQENLRVSHTINPASEDVTQRLREITHEDMPTVIIDATGNQKAINNALPWLAHGGRFILIGLQKAELIFSHPEFHKREATLMSSRNATKEDFSFVINSMKKGLVNGSNYITHRAHFDEVKNIFETWLDPKNGVIKAMVSLD
ncbi:MAG: zinc-binding alcohol dehydrogenase family protein [Bacteroidetes bacterium]|nr:zinc-binding alcohol dehydrogenase family protein [Bacteroidota bacterium]